eukprot:4145720-Prymnesium_polylepis.1
MPLHPYPPAAPHHRGAQSVEAVGGRAAGRQQQQQQPVAEPAFEPSRADTSASSARSTASAPPSPRRVPDVIAQDRGVFE